MKIVISSSKSSEIQFDYAGISSSFANTVFLSHYHIDHLSKVIDDPKFFMRTIYVPPGTANMFIEAFKDLFKVRGIMRRVPYLRQIHYLGSVEFFKMPHIPGASGIKYVGRNYVFYYLADFKDIPVFVLNKIVADTRVFKRVYVTIDSTYFSENDVNGIDIDVKKFLEIAKVKPIVMPMLATGRIIDFLTIPEIYNNVMTGRVRVIVVNGLLVRMLLHQVQWIRRFNPRISEMVSNVFRKIVFRRFVDPETIYDELSPGDILVFGGGMVKSEFSRKMVDNALKREVPVILTSYQAEGTYGRKLYASGKVFKLKHSNLRGHIDPVMLEFKLKVLYNLCGMRKPIIIPVHGDVKAIAKAGELARLIGFPVMKPLQVLDEKRIVYKFEDITIETGDPSIFQ